MFDPSTQRNFLSKVVPATLDSDPRVKVSVQRENGDRLYFRHRPRCEMCLAKEQLEAPFATWYSELGHALEPEKQLLCDLHCKETRETLAKQLCAWFLEEIRRLDDPRRWVDYCQNLLQVGEGVPRG